MSRLQIFEGAIQPTDILQGRLDDSHLMAALASISEEEHRIRKMFASDKNIREGIFGVYTYFGGEYKQVVIDNFFPCSKQKPVFSRAHGKELWVMILEKVWAKLHLSYQKICVGQAYEVFRDLLGCPSYYKKTNEKNLWEFVKDCTQKRYIMSVTSCPNESQTKYLLKKGILFL